MGFKIKIGNLTGLDRGVQISLVDGTRFCSLDTNSKSEDVDIFVSMLGRNLLRRIKQIVDEDL